MNRRGFFKHSFSKVANVSSEYIEHKIEEKAKGWIRPPFAQAELDFLLNCSRCGDCIEACPHQVIFSLPIQRGASVAGTPAMDIPNNACQLCTDWPCVTSCKDKALSFSVNQIMAQDNAEEKIVDETKVTIEQTEENIVETDQTEPVEMPQAKDCPPMASAHINESLCMPYSGPECGACMGSCPIPNTLVWHNEKPSIILENCIGCGLCVQTCITSPKAINITHYQLPIEQAKTT